MARDLFAEYGIDPSSVKSGSTATPQGSDIKPQRDLFAEYGINPQEANQSSWMPTHSIKDILGGIATGVQNVHNFVTPKSMNTNYDFNAPGSIGLGVDYPTQGDKFVQSASQYAPAAIMPEAPLIGDALGGTSMAAKYLPNMVSQGAYGASQSPDDRLGGLGLGAAGGAAGQAAGDILNALRPSQLFRGGLSPEELQSNVEATRGTNTPLGEVIASPTLNRLQENILPHILFSGSEKTSQDTANQVINQGNQIMQQLGYGIQGSNPGAQLQDALKAASAQARSDKNAMYQKVNDLADDNNLVVGRDGLQQVARDKLNEINESSELADHVDPTLKSSLQKYADNSDGNSLKLSNIFKGKLNDSANNFYQNGQMYEYGIMKSLKDSLGSDIDNSITNSGSPELKSAHQDAQKNYATNFAPFEDPDIVKFTRQGGDPDLILNHFLRTGANDRAQLLSKLQNAISSNGEEAQTTLGRQTQGLSNPESQVDQTGQMNPASGQGLSGTQKQSNLLPYSYLSRSLDGNGQVDPIQFSKLYNKLGDNQKNILIQDPETRRMLDNYSNLVSKNKESFNLMFNPKTGARNTGALYDFAQLLAGVAGGHFGGMGGAAAAQAGASIAGRAANKLLTSPSFRESLVNTMIKNKKWELPQTGKGGLSAALQMYGNSNSGQ